MPESDPTTLEWFGATTFRLRLRGLTVFLDTWLDRPSVMPKYLAIDEVTQADYIFISHAHFDHLPGADRLAIRTGAIVVANCEAINVLAKAGVPESQLFRVAGGERIPLFLPETRGLAQTGQSVAAAHIWPSLHCLMPGSHPEEIDTGEIFTGAAHEFVCTMDITRGMKYGLLKIGDHIPRTEMDDGLRSFTDYISDTKANVFSHADGGQLMVNFVVDDQAILWNAHLGAYEGIFKSLGVQPKIAILGIAGRANLNGRPFDGSAAQFALMEAQWLGEPETIVWCLHDESPIKPYRINTCRATEEVERNTASRVLALEHGKPYILDV